MALKIQHKYRVKFEQSCEAYKILEVKHQKLGKQLNFIKFSNNCLRSEIHSLQNNKGTNTKFKKVIREIQKLISNNGQNLQNNVRKLIASVQKDFDQDNNQEQGQFNAENQIKIELPNHNNRVRSVSQFSLEHPVIKQQMPLKQQNMIINSCQLKAQKDQRTKKKPSSINKQSSELHETASTEKKKRSQLAKLVEQQSRLARINQRYLSTDIY